MMKKMLMSLVLAGSAALAMQGVAQANDYCPPAYKYTPQHVSYHADCSAYWDKYVYWKGQYDYYHSQKAHYWMEYYHNAWYSCSH